MTSLVTARNVSKHFGDVRAVDDVSFDIEKGKILGWIDLTGIFDTRGILDVDAVLNGIAYDAEKAVTGKDTHWQATAWRE